MIVKFTENFFIFSFVSARTLTGFSIAGIEASCFVMGMELVGPSKRTLAGILCWFFETTGKEHLKFKYMKITFKHKIGSYLSIDIL